MQKLAESSGTVAFEHNNVVTLARKPAQWTTTFLFVTGLITLITCANGVIQMIIHRGNLLPSIILMAIGFLFMGISIYVARYRKKINAKPFDQLQAICAFDFNSGVLLDARLQPIASLHEVHIKRALQLASSSSALVVVSPLGSMTLVKGSPFSGGVSAVENALVSRGIRKG